MDQLLFDKYVTRTELESGIEAVLLSPKNSGTLEMIVRRPVVNKREVIESGFLDIDQGLAGDNWLTRGSSRTDNGKGHPEMQLNLMNYRFALLVAGHPERVPLAGDQLFVDLDLSGVNLPPGTPDDRHGNNRGDADPSFRLQEICRTLWFRRDEIR